LQEQLEAIAVLERGNHIGLPAQMLGFQEQAKKAALLGGAPEATDYWKAKAPWKAR
jgi:hypothetical protein